MALAGYDPGERANYQYVVAEIDAAEAGMTCSTIFLSRLPPSRHRGGLRDCRNKASSRLSDRTSPERHCTAGACKCSEEHGRKWWAGTGLNRRHQDFQTQARVRGSMRNCSLSKEKCSTPSCAGMIRSALELGTVWAQRKSNSCPAHLAEAAYRPTKLPRLFVNRRVCSVR
jgi:hypothetical protein